MEVLVSVVFILSFIASNAQKTNQKIEWSKVVHVSDLPGFWDDRLKRPEKVPAMFGQGRVSGG